MKKYSVKIELNGKTIQVVSTNKRDKTTWSYKRNAIKAFIHKVRYDFGWLNSNVLLGKPFRANLKLIDNTTNDIVCQAFLYNDTKYPYVPIYEIIPIDTIAKEYIKN